MASNKIKPLHPSNSIINFQTKQEGDTKKSGISPKRFISL